MLVSNAALHWLPDHAALLSRLVSLLAPSGVLAFQVPANFEAPSHRRIDEVRAQPRFAATLAPVRRGHAEPLDFYEAHLAGLGLTVDAWDTTYLHVLPGRGRGAAVAAGHHAAAGARGAGPEEGKAFLDTLRPLLRADYPATSRGTPFRFTRRFVVARRGEAPRH